MEKDQEVDLIDLLWQFLQKLSKNKFLVLLTLLIAVIIGISISKFQKKKYHTSLMVQSCLDDDILCNLIHELNLQNRQTHKLSTKIDNFSSDSGEEHSLKISLTLNDTSRFNETKKKIVMAIADTPFVIDCIRNKKRKLQILIDNLDVEIMKTEELFNQLIRSSNATQSISINFPRTIIDLKTKKINYQEDIDQLIAMKYIGFGHSSFKEENTFNKTVFLSFFIGILLSFSLVLIKKD